MEKAKRAVLEMFGTGLMSGVAWFPPRLRREIYGLLGLRVEVHADRTLQISGEFDADLMRLALGSPEVEAYVAGLQEVEERLDAAPPNGYAGQDRSHRAGTRSAQAAFSWTVRPHPCVDQRGKFIVCEELAELKLRLRLQGTDLVDSVGYLVYARH
jgi:hypothetical protein